MRSALPILLAGLISSLAASSLAAQTNLLVGPTSFEFAVPSGGSQPLPQELLVAASSSAGLAFEAHSSASWLFVSQIWGATPARPTVSVDATGLQDGVYHAFISVTSGVLAPATLEVTLRVGASAATPLLTHPSANRLADENIRAFPRGLTFISKSDANVPDPQSVFVPKSALESGVVASSSAPWLTVARPAPSGSFQEVKISANPAGLPPGQYSTSVSLRAPGGERNIPITFDVGNDAHLVAEPNVLSFRAQPGAPGLLTQTITIKSTSGQLRYSAATESGSWLAIGARSGLTDSSKADGSNTITVAVSAANLPIGTHTGSITVTAADAMEPLVVPVSVRVSAQATGISIDMTHISLTGTLGGAVQMVTAHLSTTIAGETFTVTTTIAAWLSVTPLNGTLSATTSQPLVFAADPSQATVGSNTAMVTIRGSGGEPEVDVGVEFTVQAGNTPTITASPTSLTFNFTAGTAPTPQTVMLTAPTATSFTATSNFPYVTVTSSGNSTPATLTISISPNLTAGMYNDVSISVVGGVNNVANPLVIPIGITAVAPGCVVSMNGSQITKVLFSSFLGQGPPPSQTVQLACNVTTSFTAAAGTPAWDSVTPASGMITAGSSATLTISVSPGSLPAGTQNDYITISGPGFTSFSLDVSYTISSESTITVTPSTLSFTQVAGGPAPPTQTISLTAGSSTGFTATSNASYVTVTPASGTAGATPTTLTVTANGIGLSPNFYPATITIAGGQAPIPYSVGLTITASTTPSVTISPSPSTVTFSQVSGGALPGATTVTLATSPSTATAYTTSVSTANNVNWLTVTPQQGNTGTNPTLTLTVNSASAMLGTGSFQATVSIMGGATTATVAVTLNITGTVSASPSTLTFSGVAGGASPAAQTVTLSSSQSPAFTASSNQPWLIVSPTSGTINTNNLQVSVVTSGLIAGTYTNGTISVMVAGGPTLSIPVTLTLTASSGLTASPTSLSFVQLLTGSPPAAQTLQLTAAVTTSFTASFTQTWLTVSPTTGSAGTAPTTLTVTANGGSLAAGTYTDTITITGGATAVMIPVTLTVLAGSQGIITTSALAVAFTQNLGSVAFQNQDVMLTGPTAISFSASTNASWLTVTPATGTTPATLTFTENPAGMGAGSYMGTVTVVGGAAPVTIQAFLTISVAANAITATPSSVTFTQFVDGAAPAFQTVQLTSTNPTAFTATNTQSWLTVTPASGTTNTAITLAVNSSGLTAGTYTDTVTITGGASAVTIPVSYTISPDTFLPTPATLSFTQTLGGSAAPSQTVQLTSGTAHTFDLSTDETWLTVTPTTGTSPATLTVTANGAGLALGTYNGTITVNGAGSPVTIPVTLTIATATGAIFSPTSLTFTAASGATTTSTQTVMVTSQAAQFSFAATATVSNNGSGTGNWLAVSPATGTTPASLTVTANPAGLAAGQYAGIITVTPTDSTIPTQNLPVTLTITGSSSSTTFVRSVLNGASFLPGPVSPGELISLFGLGLGPATGVGATVLASGSIDTMAGGTQVFFDGVAAPILYAQAGQVNAIVPYNVYGRTTTSMQVSISGVLATPVGLAVQDTAPAVFTVNGSGMGQSCAINQDGTINGPDFPAPAGSVIAIYGTGEGQTDPPGQDGRIIETDLRHPIASSSAMIGNLPAAVQYIGSAPTLVSGVFQMNIVVPDGLTPGQQPLQLTIGGVNTQPAITVSVK